jgi:hypothetical protein
MSKCGVCGQERFGSITHWLDCGCGLRAHVACLAATAQTHYDTTGHAHGWTHCLKCGKVFKNSALVKLMLQLWARSLRSTEEKLIFYGAVANVFAARKQLHEAAKATAKQVGVHVTLGHTVATSRPLLHAARRFGHLAYAAGFYEAATRTFDDILRHAGANGAWIGGDDLAVACMARGHNERAYHCLSTALQYREQMGPEYAAKLELALCEVCMRTFRFCEAATLAKTANAALWNAATTLEGNVPAIFLTRAAAKIAVFDTPQKPPGAQIQKKRRQSLPRPRTKRIKT